MINNYACAKEKSMPTPERIFRARGITAKGNTLSPDQIKLFSFEKGELQLNERRMKLIVEKAEERLDYQIPIIPLSTYRRYMHDGNRSEMQSYYFPRREALMQLALAEMYERKGRFTNKLIDVIWAILEETTWLISAHFRGNFIGCEDGVPNYFGDVREHDISLFATSTGALLALVYKCCRDILDEVSPIICERIKHEVTVRVIKPYANKIYYWMGVGHPYTSNWLPWITSNALFVASVFADDKPIREHIAQKAMDSLDTLFESYSPDGGCDEGPSYWTAAAGAVVDCLDTLYDMSGGKINIYDHPLIKAMGEYAVDVNIFDTNVVNFADSGCKVRPNAALMKRYAEAVGSQVMLDYSKLLNSSSALEVASGHAYRILRSIYDADVESVGPLAAKPAVYYDYIKVALVREGNVRGEGLFLAMKGGHNQENHNHNDVGTFMVYRDKTPVIVDLGSGEYINWQFQTREKCWYKDSDFHSLPAFDGIIQKTGRVYASSDEIFSAEEKSFTLQLKDTYPAEAGIISYIRRGEIKDGAVILTDDVLLDTEREIDFAFTTPTEPKIEGNTFILADGVTLSCSESATLITEAHETAFAGCKTWGDVIYRAHFKVKSKGGKFVFTIK